MLGVVLSERENPVAETRTLLDSKSSKDLDKGPAGPWLAELGRRILGH